MFKIVFWIGSDKTLFFIYIALKHVHFVFISKSFDLFLV